MSRKLTTMDQVIEAIGGIDAFLELTKANRKQVWHWRVRAKLFPGYTYTDITKALKRRGKTASDALWNMSRRAKAA